MTTTSTSIYSFPSQHPEHWGCRSAGVSPSSITVPGRTHTCAGRTSTFTKISKPKFWNHQSRDSFLCFQLHEATQPFFYFSTLGLEEIKWLYCNCGQHSFAFHSREGFLFIVCLRFCGDQITHTHAHASTWWLCLTWAQQTQTEKCNCHSGETWLSCLGLGYESFGFMSGFHQSKKPTRPRVPNRNFSSRLITLLMQV